MFRTGEINRYHSVKICKDGKILSLQEENNSFEHLVNGGVYFVNPRTFSSIPFNLGCKLSLEEDLFPAAIALGHRFFGKEFRSSFIDIGIPQDYHRASEILNNLMGE